MVLELVLFGTGVMLETVLNGMSLAKERLVFVQPFLVIGPGLAQ